MRRGFTLMEVLISVLIFSIISLAMIGVLTGSVKIFRAGETARAAHDDAVAVLAQLDDDLALMVPPGDGGFLYTRVRDTILDNSSFDPDQYCSMVLAFKMKNPDARAATINAANNSNDTDTGNNTRQIVCWFVGDDGSLNRTVWNAVDPNYPRDLDKVAKALSLTGKISKDCLYFGVDVSMDQPIPGGSSSVSTRPDLTWAGALPIGKEKFCTEPPNATSDSPPFPRALRVSLTLTGGSRNLLKGTVVSDSASGIRITGVGQVPTGPGALARIGDPTDSTSQVEWVHYDTAAQGILKLAGVRPIAVRRTGLDASNNPVVISHRRGEPVVFGTTYSLVRTLPR